MHLFITGNLGYVGPSVIQHLRDSYPNAILSGFDTGFFSACLTAPSSQPDTLLDTQHAGDIRNISDRLLQNVDAVIHLAAISNDPMGNAYEQLTEEINYHATIQLARKAKQAGVSQFVFASSCSVYGCAEGSAVSEESPVNPLTAYAKSKVSAEQGLRELADEHFKITCLRFPTACGMSTRLRLDLVLNDFVASAITSKKISILSDGSPWRPLINTKDMARAIDWAVIRDPNKSGAYLVINAGDDKANYNIKQLADAVASVIPNTEISINPLASADKRSYKINFMKFKMLAPETYHPRYDLIATIKELKDNLETIQFQDHDFRNSFLIRLNYLSYLKNTGLLDSQLFWT